jgi:hypothetical protein
MSCVYHEGWRSTNHVQERHEMIVELAQQIPPLLLKDISRQIKERYGANPRTGKAMDHSSLLYQIRKHREKRCACL